MRTSKNRGITCEVTAIPPSERSITGAGPIGLVYEIDVSESVARLALGWGYHEQIFDTMYSRRKVDYDLRNYRATIRNGADLDPNAIPHMAFLRSGRAWDEEETFVYGMCGIRWSTLEPDKKIAKVARRAMRALTIVNMGFDELPEGDSVIHFSPKKLATAPDQYIDYTL